MSLEIGKVDVLIIGAGPSGSVAAGYLHKKGFKVCVVERQFFPRFVIGESLLPRCMEHFKEAELLDAIKKENYEVKTGARFLRNEEVCEFFFDTKYGEGWDWTWQVPRADFDKALTDDLEHKGVDILFGHEVINVDFNKDGSSLTKLKTNDEKFKTIAASFIIDSSGYGRVLPRLLQLDAPTTLPEHSSIFTHVKDVNRPSGREGTLITFDILETQVWLWVIPFSNGKTSIGAVGPTAFFDTLDGDATSKLKMLFDQSLHYANRFKTLPYLFEAKQIKNYAKAVTRKFGKGYVITGNSAAFLDPVFSSGVTFATESALRAAKLLTKEFNGEKVNWQQNYADTIDEGVAVFETYVKEWYTGNLQEIFFQKNSSPEIKEQICAVLAGYVWDKSNPFVKKHNNILSNLAHVIRLSK